MDLQEKKLKTWLVVLVTAVFIGILLVVMAVVVNQQSQQKAPTRSTRTLPTSTPTPTLTPEQELESLDVGEVETDLSSLDRDLQEL